MFVLICKLLLFLACLTPSESFLFEVFEKPDHNCSMVFGETCQTFKLAEESCLNFTFWDTRIQSINTSGNCMKIWTKSNCDGEYSIIAPGTKYHHDLNLFSIPNHGGRKWARNVVSVSGCECSGKSLDNLSTNNSTNVTNGPISDCPEGENEKDCPKSISSPQPTTIKELDMETFEIYDSSDLREAVRDIPIIAFLKSQPNLALDARTVVYKPFPKVAIYLHGYATKDLNDGLKMKNAFFNGTDDVDVVILLDWREWSLPTKDSWFAWPNNYRVVAKHNLPKVAKVFAKFIETKLHKENHIHLVAFSMGAHIAGTASRSIARKSDRTIDRISGLDPAGPIFENSLYFVFDVDTTHTLRKTDAAFVDIIHSSSFYGMHEPVGHVDFFLTEDTCRLPSCKHQKSVESFVSSLTTCSFISCPQKGCRTSDWNDLSSLGYLSNLYTARGNQFLKLTDGKCSSFMNVRLPAKERICRQGPKSESDCHSEKCVNSPYLSTCTVSCSNEAWREIECASRGLSLSSRQFNLTEEAVTNSSVDGNVASLEKIKHLVEWLDDSNCTAKVLSEQS